MALLGAVALAGPLKAQEAVPDFYKEPGIQPNRDYVNQHATEHVDPFTGSLQIHSTDIHLPGNGGFDLKVIRSFNSSRINPLNPADLANSSLTGLGWTVHFGRVLKKGSSSNVCQNTDGGTAIGDNPVLELPDGSRQVLAFTASTSPLMLTTQRWRADCLPGSGLAVHSPDGIRYDMTQQVQEVGGAQPITAWYTTRITDRNGNHATIGYAAAASAQISGVSASDGRSIAFGYLDPGTLSRRISSITTGGRTWTYSYEAIPNVVGRHFLTAVTRPDAVGSSWRYAYHTAAGTDSADHNQLSQITHPQGGTVAFGYAHVFFDTTSNPNSRSVVVASKTTSAGGTWSFAYTPGANSVYDTTVVTTPAGDITYRHFGANFAASGSVWRIGLLHQKQTGTLQVETNTWGSQQISTENNLRQGAFPTKIDTEVYAPILTQRTIVRNGVAHQTSYSNHDAHGNPQTVVEAGPNGGNRTTQLTYHINTAKWIVNQLSNETVAGVGSVLRTWDGNGNLLSETRDGVATSYTRHAEGDVWTITRPRGLVTTYTNHVRGIPQNEAQPEGVNVSRIVSDAGNVTSETDGEGNTTTYQYDGLNRVTRITPPVGNATTISYGTTVKTATRGALQQVTTHNGFGQATGVTTGGLAIVARYDSLGRKTFESKIGSTTVGRTYLYDILNRLTRVTHNADNSFRSFTYSAVSGVPRLAVRDERGHITTHAYRAYGDPDAPLVMGITAPVAAANVSITRNGRGLVTSVTQAGITRQFIHDARNYLVSTVHPEVGTTVYGRDAAGNMTSRQVGSSGTSTFEYDGRNRLWRVTYPDGDPSQVVNTYWRTDRLRTVTNAVATRSYGYDRNLNLTTESLVVDGLTMAATYHYNANDQMSSIVYPVLGRTVSFSPNALGRPTGITSQLGPLLNATFWPNGQINHIAYTGGSSVVYGQNTREWLNAITVRTGDNVARVNSVLTYDTAGNLVTVADSADSTFNRTLAFDAINRLTTANGPWGTGSFTYSGSGNVLTQVVAGVSRASTHDTQHRLLTHGGGGVSHDVYGNIVGTAEDSYRFDHAGNLRSRGSGVANGYGYDGTNTRVTVREANSTTHEFRSAHGLLLAQWTQQPGSYDTLKEHLHLAGKEVAEQRTHFLGEDVQPAALMYLQPDANGSPITATSATGGLLFKEGYRPYGSQINGLAGGFTKRGFAGHAQEQPNLIYMGGRYYNPLLARFLSIDPKEADPSDLHSLNRYAYANNNPYRYVDPDGHTPLDLAFLAIDAYRLGSAVLTGGDVRAAALDVGFSALGVISPVPGVGQGMRALRVADRVVEGARDADRVLGAAKGVGEASSLANAARLRGQLAGKEIAGGHAFEKHVLNQGEFKGLGIRTRERFANHIENVVNNPTASRQLSGGRSAYWQDSTGTVVIRNPRAADGGTAFQPTNGRAYFDGLR
jgi:RHS repeat-associated protein